ncbi:hypothetical protein GGR54DRAFT_640914 [Hypoxylon sp. NC1633]|nr:hypothetical protein GGR54DRAFT_640914 [Hypoxylon sp. NC1633]
MSAQPSLSQSFLSQRHPILRRRPSATPSIQASSSLHRPQLGYPRYISALPAANSYLPQQRWPQEYGSMPGAPRAVPLRMSRAAALNRVDSRPSPIALSQLSSDRPYSVPPYLSHRMSNDGDANSSHPPRPATSFDVRDLDRMVMTRSVPLSQRRIAEYDPNGVLLPRTISPEEGVHPNKTQKTTRAVAKRGSRKLPPESKTDESSQTALSSQQDLSQSMRGQKRVAEYADGDFFFLKKAKTSMTMGHSQTDLAAEASAETPSAANQGSQEGRVGRVGSAEKEATAGEEDYANTGTLDGDETVTGSENEDGPLAKIKSRRKARMAGSSTDTNAGKLDPCTTIDRPGSAKSPQAGGNPHSVPEVTKSRNTDIIDKAPGDMSRSRTPSTMLQEPDAESQGSAATRRQYTTASAQCDLSPYAARNFVPQKELDPDPDLELPPFACQPTPDAESLTSVGGATETNVGNDHASENENDDEEEGQASQLSRIERIEEVLSAQRETGMDGFIAARLGEGGAGMLERLADDVLLGMLLRENDLVEQVVGVI